MFSSLLLATSAFLLLPSTGAFVPHHLGTLAPSFLSSSNPRASQDQDIAAFLAKEIGEKLLEQDELSSTFFPNDVEEKIRESFESPHMSPAIIDAAGSVAEEQPSFIKTMKCEGFREGYIYRGGENGFGYYLNEIEKQTLERKTNRESFDGTWLWTWHSGQF